MLLLPAAQGTFLFSGLVVWFLHMIYKKSV